MGRSVAVSNFPHDVGREFIVKMRRDARLKPRLLARVIPLGDLRHLVQARDHG